MTIEQLLAGKLDCACKMPHICPTEHVYIEKDACRRLPELTSGYKSILAVADTNTYAAIGETVCEELGEKLGGCLVYERSGILVPDEEAIAELEAAIVEGTELIVGIGSGVINDLCKIVSFRHSLPYFIVATAPSMDGYASKGSALILDGMKITLNAEVPKAIIADTKVLSEAPMEMIRAGYGDIIGKYSCLNDWRLSRAVRGEYLCDFVMNATYETVEKTVALAEGIGKREPDAIGALMEALVAVGILMAYVGNSRPASGSEHHMSHYFEIVGIVKGEDYLPHGIDVCCSAVETAKLREALLSVDINAFEYGFDRDRYEREIRRIYGSVAPEVLALQEKMGWYGEDRIGLYREKWGEICEILRDCPSSSEMLELCERVGISYKEYRALYGDEKIAEGLLYSKDLKDRYTVLWLYYDLFGNK